MVEYSLSNRSGVWVVVAIEGETTKVGTKLAVGSLSCPQISTVVMFIVIFAISLQGDSKVAKVLVTLVCGISLSLEVRTIYCFTVINKLWTLYTYTGGSQSISKTHVPGRSDGNSVAAAFCGASGWPENKLTYGMHQFVVTVLLY